jgi:hypothetical protein
MSWFKKQYCQLNNINIAHLGLFLQGQEIKDQDTPHSLHIFDDDEIKAVLQRPTDNFSLHVVDQVPPAPLPFFEL